MKFYIVVTDVAMTLLIPAKVLLHVWSYDFYDMTLSTGKQRRHMIKSFIFKRKNVNYVGKNWIFNVFAQNIHCGYTLEPNTHNVCFGSKIRNCEYPCKPQFFLYKSGV